MTLTYPTPLPNARRSRYPGPVVMRLEHLSSAGDALGNFRTVLTGLLDQLQVLLDPPFQARIDGVRARLLAERVKILVVGEFSRGKSTFINALIGRPVLPSRVNPTTATINVITGDSPAVVRIEYHDGRTEVHDLPEQDANRFLDRLVTTANAEAAKIRSVRIQVPGRIGELGVEIVDTPGVNDLDQAREEVTYGYLRRADAAVLLLDAQQPFSQSERVFLRDKIHGSDVRRVLFVVNKIDEVLTTGKPEDVPRILGHVQSIATTLVGSDVEVYGVSSKGALRQRANGVHDPLFEYFESFEQALLRFAAAQARQGRLSSHVERLRMLIEDQDRMLEERERALAADVSSSERTLSSLERQRVEAAATCVGIRKRATAELNSLRRKTETVICDEVARFRRASDSDVGANVTAAEFRALFARRTRDLQTEVERRVAELKREAVASLDGEFEGQLADGSRSSWDHARFAEAEPAEFPGPSGKRQQTAGDEDHLWAGVGLGVAAGAIFGPIGVAAAVIGTLLFGAHREEQILSQRRADEVQSLRVAIARTCDALSARAPAAAAALLGGDALVGSFDERARRRYDEIASGIAAHTELRSKSREARISDLKVISERRRGLNEVQHRLEGIEHENSASAH